MRKNPYILAPLSVFVALFCVFGLYWLGLGGVFLLDDFGNLQPLFKDVNEKGFWVGIFAGDAGPLGRPLSLLTFALQQQDWPDPSPFKLINVCIHVLNAILVGVLIYILLPHLFPSIKNCLYVAIIIATIWSILPIQISTVLYVVQRMVLLSSFFMLVSILCYLWARYHILQSNYIKAWVILTLGVAGSSLLSIFSKESGLLVYAFIICIELVMQNKMPIENSRLRSLLIFLLSLPLILFVAYLCYSKFYEGYSGREFSLEERLLTQSRILFDYMQQTALPIKSELGLYHDDYLISKSLFEPMSTLYAISGVILLLCLGVWSKLNNKMWIFFSVSWFLSGHLMESTILPLEMYFEHRNYLSSLGVILFVIGLIAFMHSVIKSQNVKKLISCLIMVYIFLIISSSYLQVSLWGNPTHYFILSAKENPQSLRARILMIDYYDAIKQPSRAYEEIDNVYNDFPNEVSLRLVKLHFACEYPELALPDIESIKTKIGTGRFSHATVPNFVAIIDIKKQGRCQQLKYSDLLSMVELFKKNENYQKVSHKLLRLTVTLNYEMGNIESAITAAEKMTQADHSDDAALFKLYLLNKQIVKAKDLLERMELKSKKRLSSREYELKEIDVLKAMLPS